MVFIIIHVCVFVNILLRIYLFFYKGGVSVTVSERIQTILKEKSLTQKGLSAYIDVPPSTVNTWIKFNRDIPAQHIIYICEFLKISAEYLLTGKETKKEHSSPQLNEDESELLNLFQQLDKRGKTKALNACYDEIDRMKQEQAATTAVNQSAG